MGKIVQTALHDAQIRVVLQFDPADEVHRLERLVQRRIDESAERRTVHGREFNRDGVVSDVEVLEDGFKGGAERTGKAILIAETPGSDKSRGRSREGDALRKSN
jgi:hypothetical protein